MKSEILLSVQMELSVDSCRWKSGRPTCVTIKSHIWGSLAYRVFEIKRVGNLPNE